MHFRSTSACQKTHKSVMENANTLLKLAVIQAAASAETSACEMVDLASMAVLPVSDLSPDGDQSYLFGRIVVRPWHSLPTNDFV